MGQVLIILGVPIALGGTGIAGIQRIWAWASGRGWISFTFAVARCCSICTAQIDSGAIELNLEKYGRATLIARDRSDSLALENNLAHMSFLSSNRGLPTESFALVFLRSGSTGFSLGLKA
jgi:hypothetical protein